MKINDYLTSKRKKILIALAVLMSLFYYFNGVSYLKYFFRDRVKISESKAIDIAETELLKVYGRGVLEEMPLHAELDEDNTWVIRGSTQCGSIGCKSHSVVVVISAENGTLINIYRQQ